jgi:hypothetical protein
MKNREDERIQGIIYTYIYTILYIIIFIVMYYIYKCHKETLCIAVLYKQNCLFSKTENGMVKQALSGKWHQWDRREYRERVQEGECSENIMYSCMQMEK